MNEPFEYCPVKSFVCKALRHPFTWVLGGVVFGALSMYALGKVSDLEKVVWFTAGTSITAVATVVQVYLSNKRAYQEREFNRLEAIRKHITEVRLKAYENFIQCSLESFDKKFSASSICMLADSNARVRIVGSKRVADACCKIIEVVKECHENTAPVQDESDRLPEGIPQRFGANLAKLTHAMRLDLGADSVTICTPTSTAPRKT